MEERSPRIIFAICRIAIIAAFLFLSAHQSFAQDNPVVESPEPKEDAEGCADLTIFPRLPTTIIDSCQSGELLEVTMPLKPDAQGYAREKRVRGPYEFREYQSSQEQSEDQQEQAFDNLMQLLSIAGFTVKHSISPTTITGRKEDTWILVQVGGQSYSVTVVRAKEEPWIPPDNAEAIAREVQVHGRAAIYGIQFSETNDVIVEENSRILGELLKYLQGNPGLVVVVESHKKSEDGTAQDDREITQKRVTAVVTWLEAHGISAGRLQSKALGREKPITENDTPSEIQRNERIELVKVGS